VIATTADEPQPLAEINSIDDLVFLASQAFDNNDPMHLDLLPAALVNLQDRLTESDLAKLEPSIQRAYKITKGNANAGVLDDLLATFLVEVMRVFAGKFPRTGEFLKTIEAEYTRKDEERKKQWAEFKARVMNLEHWRTSDNDTSYQIHKRVLYAAFVQISNGTKLPLLSTPTHQYGFIDPVVLVDRIALLQQRYFVPYTIDFQVAISRIAPFNHEVALQQVKGKLKGEPLRVMEFLLRKDAAPVPPFDTPELWFVAGVTKLPGHVYNEFRNFVHSERRRSIYTGEAEWTVSIEKNKRYDFGQRKDIELETTSTFLRIEHHNTMGEEARQQQPTEGLLTKLSGLFSKKKVEGPETASYSVIHEFLRRSNGFLNASHGDVTRLIYLFPNNPDPVIALFGLQRLFESTLSSEMDKEVVTQIQRAVLPLHARNSETSHLFIATCMLTSDKTVRAFAAEMWIRAVRSCITSVRTGEIIGKELGLGYAPVKRFTDLTSSNLLQVSQVHNRELEILLNNVLPGLPDEPPTGTKRLLELYSEILAINKSSVTEPGLKAKLQSWSSSPSLKKAVASLL